MLIQILRPIVRLALWIFFRTIDIRGGDRVPAGQRLIFVANHPNVMLDVLILGLYAPGGTPRFLGKSTLFKRPLYAWFMHRFGVIPVARTQDTGSRMSRNRDMLRLASQSLGDGHALALFPEGGSHATATVRELKPGAARIALRTEAEADGQGSVCLIPVGLSYSDPGLFRSDIAVHFGEAIDVHPFLQTYRESRDAVERELTATIHERLTALTWQGGDPDIETVIRDLSAICAGTIATDLPDSVEFNKRLRAGQEIIRAAHHFASTDPEFVQTFAARLRAHHSQLRRFHLDLPTVSSGASSPRVRHLLMAVLFSPLALYGCIHNILPCVIPCLAARPYRDSPEMIGTVKLTVGVVVFPLFYLILMGAASLLMGLFPALLYGLTLPLSGLFVLWYNEHILQKWPLWQNIVLLPKRRSYLQRLSEERSVLIHDLDILKERYLATLG